MLNNTHAAVSDMPSTALPGSDQSKEAITRGHSPIDKAVFTIVVLAVGFTLYLTASLVLPILIAAFLSILLAPAVRGLVGLRIPQSMAAAMVVVIAVGFAGTLLFHLYSPVQSWLTSGGATDLRTLERKLRVVRGPVEAVKNATKTVASLAEGELRAPTVVKIADGSPLDLMRATQSVVLTTLSTILLTYFFLASGNLFLRKLVQATPKLRDKIRTVEMGHNLQREISHYFATITLINCALGVVTGSAMWALGMPTPLLLGVMVALLNFLPYLGPLLASVVLAAIAIVTFDTPLAMILPPLVYLLLHLIEGQLVLPFVLGRRMAVNPVIVFLWLLIWTWMWGAPGAVIAVPMLVAVRICAERIEFLAPLAGMLALDVAQPAAPDNGAENHVDTQRKQSSEDSQVANQKESTAAI